MTDDRLARQVAFLVDADKLKHIFRRTPLIGGSRLENSAEHSWHLVLVAMIVREYAASPIDMLHVLEMLAVHDLVEIDAGDTFAYDAAGIETKIQRELAAAERIFGLLPQDQGQYVRALWEEFEAQDTPDAKFANAIDRLQPFLLNAHGEGGSWSTHHLTCDQVLTRMSPIESAMPALWPLVVRVIDAFCDAGIIRRVAD